MQRILHPGKAEQTINKSRFVAVAEYCSDERAVVMLLRRLASAHAHAHHLAFAFRVQGENGLIQRFHDAGEPTGTAGKPILQHLEGRDLINSCVAVVRYYGGINLGTGGLARAYGSAARQALDAAGIAPYVELSRIALQLNYPQLDVFMRELARLGGELLDKQFSERISVLASVPVDAVAALRQRFGN
jgi:uncharacterized YigZ family protein